MDGIQKSLSKSLAKTTCEEWQDIKGYEGIYQVSNLGRVRSLTRKVHNYTKKGIVLKTYQKNEGYLYVSLSRGNGEKQKHAYVHRLVAEAFISNPNNHKQVNHINCDKTDNRKENLEWVSPQQNVAHFRNSALAKKYDEKKQRTLINKSIQYIIDFKNVVCAKYNEGYSVEAVAKLIGLGRDRVTDILKIYELL